MIADAHGRTAMGKACSRSDSGHSEQATRDLLITASIGATESRRVRTNEVSRFLRPAFS
jgi:hypothetical protein